MPYNRECNTGKNLFRIFVLFLTSTYVWEIRFENEKKKETMKKNFRKNLFFKISNIQNICNKKYIQYQKDTMKTTVLFFPFSFFFSLSLKMEKQSKHLLYLCSYKCVLRHANVWTKNTLKIVAQRLFFFKLSYKL